MSCPSSSWRGCEDGHLVLANVTTKGLPCYAMAVHPSASDLVSTQLLHQGRWEVGGPGDDDMLDVAQRRHHVFLDIGGNIGAFTMAFAQAGYRVITFEPMKSNRRALEASLCLNPKLRTRVHVEPVALTSAVLRNGAQCIAAAHFMNAGNAKMACAPHLSCASRAHVLGKAHFLANPKYAACQEVALDTLDDALRRLLPSGASANVSAVKLDVESHECDVLAGGESLFTTYRPRWVRAENEAGEVRACYREMAARHGYRVHKRYGCLNLPLGRDKPPTYGPQECDVLLVDSRARDDLRPKPA